jgi:monoamine oxidase
MFNKQTVLGATIGAVLTLATIAGTAYAGLFDSVTTSGWDDKDVTTKYKLDVHGFDVRVYEWIPTNNPKARIVFVAGEHSSGVGSYIAEQ